MAAPEGRRSRCAQAAAAGGAQDRLQALHIGGAGPLFVRVICSSKNFEPRERFQMSFEGTEKPANAGEIPSCRVDFPPLFGKTSRAAGPHGVSATRSGLARRNGGGFE